MTTEQAVDLMELTGGDIGITSAFGAFLAEAASICLSNQRHNSGIRMTIVDRGRPTSRVINWLPITEQMLRSWHDLQEATEYGATGVALLVAKKLLRLSAVDRSAKGPGFDYWLGDDSDIPFAKKARLEISGIVNGDEQRIRARLNQKIKQTEKSDGAFPALIIVVEFGRPISHVVAKNERA